MRFAGVAKQLSTGLRAHIGALSILEPFISDRKASLEPPSFPKFESNLTMALSCSINLDRILAGPYKIELGEVSKKSKNCLFVPGSVSDACEAGKQFAASMAEKGIEMSWINSQMDITEYPGQKFHTEASLTRNKIVVEGIKKFIQDSPDDTVKIIAHSAGNKEALTAIRNLVSSPEYTGKKIQLIMCGAGGVSEDLEKDLQAIEGYPQVSVHEFRTSTDIIPFLVGTGEKEVERKEGNYHLTILHTKHEDEAREIVSNANDLEPENFNVFRFGRLLSTVIESHFIENYEQPIADLLLQDKTSPAKEKPKETETIFPSAATFTGEKLNLTGIDLSSLKKLQLVEDQATFSKVSPAVKIALSKASKGSSIIR